MKEMEQLYSELFEAASVGRRLGEDIAGVAGQTQARWQTLWTIGDGALTVPQISRRLGVSRQNIQRLATQLHHEGLIDLASNPDHKTSPLLTLTPAGQQALDSINTAADSFHREILERFPPSDAATLRDLLTRFTKAMQPQT